MPLQELRHHVRAERKGHATVVFAPPDDVLFGIRPQKVAQQPWLGFRIRVRGRARARVRNRVWVTVMVTVTVTVTVRVWVDERMRQQTNTEGTKTKTEIPVNAKQTDRQTDR